MKIILVLEFALLHGGLGFFKYMSYQVLGHELDDSLLYSPVVFLHFLARDKAKMQAVLCWWWSLFAEPGPCLPSF